jgi:hypothetical protein
MGQEPAAPAEGQEPKADEPKEAPDTQPSASGEPTTFSPEYVKELRAEAARHRKEAQEAKAKASEYEDRDKSELEKITGKLTKAEERAQAAENTLLRFQVAAEKQLPKELIPRLRGSTEEELAADADELLNLVKSRNDNDKPDFDGGAREPAPEPKTPEEQHNEAILGLMGLSTPNNT